VAPLSPALERVIAELCRLPGIGRKTAQRLALHLLKVPREEVGALASALGEMRDGVRLCSVCFHFSDGDLCSICSDARRDRSLLCVVEEAGNVVAIERTGAWRGLYHVLGGSLSPLKDVGPENLRFEELVARVRSEEVREVVLAMNPDVDGEATAVYIARLLKALGAQITRLAQGLPAGADLEFTDDLTLTRALEGRRTY